MKTAKDYSIIENKRFLERMSKTDELIEDNGVCGIDHNIFLMGQIAREMLENKEFEDSINKWSKSLETRWQESKYFKLYEECVAAGIDPNKAFEEKGWEL